MTASTRFLGFAVLAWAGVRAVSLGLVPGSGAVASSLPTAALAAPTPGAIATTEFAPLDPVTAPPKSGEGGYEAGEGSNAAPTYAPRADVDAPYPRRRDARRVRRLAYAEPREYAYADATPRQSRARIRYLHDDGRSYVSDTLMPEPRRLPFSGDPMPPEPAPMKLASTSMPTAHGPSPASAADPAAPPLLRKSNRLELSSWAMMRGKPGDILGPNSLAATGATLGGSQAGARITYWATPHLAASLRMSSPIGGARGGEVGLGVRFRPWLSVPFAITAERRQRFGRAGGRNDFALSAEGGLWDKPMPMGFRLNAYAQAGVVGIKSHDLFGDGAFTLTRPIWRNISAGFGMWGGAQPHLFRLDAGPRLTIAMKHGIRVHADYRQRLRGTAFPSSGPSVTIAGEF
jgi:hypothetical protein